MNAPGQMPRRRGHYLGTEVDEHWWRRLRKDGLFARGIGEYWWDERALYFRRYLTRTPIAIPFAALREIKTGAWHAGRWCTGQTVVKLTWERDGQRLSSGLVLAKAAADHRAAGPHGKPGRRARRLLSFG